MTQPDFPTVRGAVAAYLAAQITGLRATANRFGQINPPTAVIMPVSGSLIRYQTTTDGETDYTLRAVLLVSEGDSSSGQDVMDGYLSPVGANSVHAAVQKDPTLGGAVSWCAVTEATGYGLTNFNGVDYLGCSLVLSVGT